ncbi:MAG: hypothetical protein EWV53_18745 [Microcystis panniformis Mp_MB_F_20051200_S9]|uniref:Uncharacterized protein n=1 Tax=Microcystis panniformis Mp_MB_F_20051200_S9 TaxID=2486223 RepID=A0A552PNB6_9CHRO|nr:MAG: hypothetical protein EWV42_19160 [Microcystis panniformis Mp_GB_SS_20050300_S99D]TRV47273.1 MAG: hypothetical protein EWV87_14485 [Microcystis panniformis Mp_GB_SS_20050300_S99]TRV49698.1 MAG: hypothetical protein EWV43_07920 [Microcystis panniformis Mp_MB_F_20080800_S26D]TRV58480.1 MAG: hypothetical protein EWV53_18745 [Microcystis panniformis Mp_MB_F_20051200_S9]TRV64009.1 MAG: hypothetical protein EWV69_02500 [Microcystis panniformis Mp_MB_F_20080800_S26]TRV66832.1 MAG: hypothetical
MVVTSRRSQNRNVLEFMTEEPFAPLGGVVILPLCYPRRLLPQNQCHWLLAPPPKWLHTLHNVLPFRYGGSSIRFAPITLYLISLSTYT